MASVNLLINVNANINVFQFSIKIANSLK